MMKKRRNERDRRWEDDEYDDEDRYPVRRRANGGSSSALVLGLIGGGLALILVAGAIVFGVVHFSRSSGKSSAPDSDGERLLLQESGRVAKGDPPVDVVRPGGALESRPAKRYPVTLTEGKTYLIEMAPGATTPNYSTYVYLRNQNGEVVEHAFARMKHRCKASGRYEIVASSFGPNPYGEFTLKVVEE